MWQFCFLCWSIFIVILIVFFSPNTPTGPFQSIGLGVPACACPLAHADLLSKSWAGGHWLWITKSYLFISILLLSSLDLSAAPPSVTCLSLSSPSQMGSLSSSSSQMGVWSPIFTPPPFTFPQATFFRAVSCRAGSAPSLCQAHPGAGHSLLLSLQCWAALQRAHTDRLRAGFVFKPLSSWKGVAIENSSGVEEVLNLHKWCHAC